MKFTYNWLKDHLETSATPEEVSKKLTAIGLEVESLENNAEALKAFTVAEILSAERHPEADRLQVCRVNTGMEELQIVCGAPNARAGIKVVLAKEGTLIPNGEFKIKKSKIRGVESNGMLCSADELNLGGDAKGIIELPSDAPLGVSVVSVLGLDDAVFDVAITPNRGDCLGVRGIARDLAAAGLGTLKPLKLPSLDVLFQSSIRVNVQNSLACPLYIGCEIKGAKNGTSPEWMQRRLTAIGARPISALVDITNYLTFDLGRPAHVYDAHKLRGDIHVRSAEQGETLAALNDKTYTLEEGMTVIADDSGVIGLAGIIGGVSTACDETTTNVFLEIAIFDAISIAETGRKLGIDSDARYRFERQVDAAFAQTGAEMAIQYIMELCGGTVSGFVINGQVNEEIRRIAFRYQSVARLGGINVPDSRIRAILNAIGCEILPGSDALSIIPPSFRTDMESEADLVEEVLRMEGYDTIPSLPLPAAFVPQEVMNGLQKRRSQMKRILAAQGFTECVTWAFVSEKEAAPFAGKNPLIHLQNPISQELGVMRPSLLPGLLSAYARNTARGHKDLALFETGKIFKQDGKGLESYVSTAIRTRQFNALNVHGAARRVDLFDAKQDALAALENLGIDTSKLLITRDVPSWYHPGCSGALTLGGKVVLGYFGELHPSLLASFDIDSDVAVSAVELNLEAIPYPRAKAKPPLHLSEYQGVNRDFAFVVPKEMQADALVQSIQKVNKNLIQDVSVFDVYTGKGLPEGSKSLAINVSIQPHDRTLEEKDIEALHTEIVTAANAIGATLRQ